MRMTTEELLKKYPSWNTDRHDIGRIMYGDEPLIKWDKKEYDKHSKLTDTLANLQAAEAFIYTQYGDYYIYNTLIGRVYIAEDGQVLCGDINIHYRGCNSVSLNKMYGFNALDILRIGGQNVVGFSNADGIGSPSIYTKEMDGDTVEKIINSKMDDYGVGIQKFMEAVREQYYADTTNHIMNKRFSIKR